MMLVKVKDLRLCFVSKKLKTAILVEHL